MRIERTGSIKNAKRVLVVEEWDIKSILTHVALCVESVVFVGEKAEKVDAIEAFKTGLEISTFLSNIEKGDYDEIKLELDLGTEV